MKVKVSVTIMSLLILLSISSFLWINSLFHRVEDGYASHLQLAIINQLGLHSILYKRLNLYSQQDKKKKWQNIAKVLAKDDGEIAFKLANYYLAKPKESYRKNRNGELWLKQAIRLNHKRSRIALAKIYLEEHSLLAAKKLLLPIQSDPSALKLLIEISILTGEYKNIDYYIQQFTGINSDDKTDEQQSFYQKLERYKIINRPVIATEVSCLAKISPFATSLENLEYFEKLISSARLVPLKPYICFSPVKYISKIQLDCQHDEKEAIRCNESIWQGNNLVGNDRFIAVLVEKGGANVNAGILYIDSYDNEDVLFHELTHLLGFIDEYELAENHYRCLSVQNLMFSHNIAILPRFYQGSRQVVREKILSELPWAKYIESHTPLVSKTEQGWKLGTAKNQFDNVGAYIAESCDEQDFVAIQPLNQRTTMRYYEEVFPNLYLQMLADNPKKFLMPHYLQNVNRALKAKK
ncbi:MAG: hypothetical protein ACJAXS_000530 [Colwellia sp.]|jgi:hypothetical protein